MNYICSSALYREKSFIPEGSVEYSFAKNLHPQIRSLSERTDLKTSNAIVIRRGNVYWPLLSTKNVMNQIQEQTRQLGDLVVDDVTSIRGLVQVQNKVHGISMLALMDLAENRKPKMYNFGVSTGASIGEFEISTLDLVGQTERREASMYQVRVAFSAKLDYNDTPKACGWTPRISLRQGKVRLLTLSPRMER